MLTGPIHDDVASVIVAQLLYLESQSTEKPISMYINSPGGVVSAGLAIYDTMQFVSPPIATLCVGQACSMASLLLAAGAPNMRRALPNARVMIHQPMGGSEGQAEDIRVEAEQILKIKGTLVTMYAQMTGNSREQIMKDLDRDNYMSAQQALDYGLIDKIVTSVNGP